MMIPPLVFCSSSSRRTTTRSCKGLNFMDFAPRTMFGKLRMCRFGTQPKRVPNVALEILSPPGSVKAGDLKWTGFVLLGLPARKRHHVIRRSDLEDGVVRRSRDAVDHIPREERECIASRGWCEPLDADLAERGRLAPILVVPSLGRVAGLIAVTPADGHELERDRPLAEPVLYLLFVEIHALACRLFVRQSEVARIGNGLVFNEGLRAVGIREGEGMHAEIIDAGIACRDRMAVEPGRLLRRFRMRREEGVELCLVAGSHRLEEFDEQGRSFHEKDRGRDHHEIGVSAATEV